MAKRKGMVGMIRAAFSDFSEDDCSTQAAALSYFTVFSLPPLLVLIIVLASLVFDPADVQHAIQGQMQGLIGPAGGEAIQSILTHAQRPEGWNLATVLGIIALILGAGGAFLQLQSALNRAWEVKPDPRQGGIRNFLMKRLLSLGMVLALGFLLLVSLAIGAALSALGGAVSRFVPGLSAALLLVINHLVSLVVTTALFAAIFRYLPDAVVRFRDVWVGALVTGLLFEAGKFGIEFYIGKSNPGEAFGAAGSLALVLVWIYYSSMLILFGAEFTQVWASERGRGIRPEPGAVHVVEETREVWGERT